MKTHMKAVETTGRIDEEGELHLDEPLTSFIAGSVRVILLQSEPSHEGEEQEWLRAAASSPAFDFLKDEAEEIYSPADGKPFYDEG